MAKRVTDEIAAIAVASGYDGPAPKNKVEALNALALALGYDGAYQKRTADAINAVGTVAGGGGGASIGNLVPAPIVLMETPTIGGSIENTNSMLPPYVAIGGKKLFDGELADYTQKIASGLEVGINNDAGYNLSAYVLTITSGTPTIAAMESWPIENKTIDGHQLATWIMPTLASNNTEFQLFGVAQSSK